MKINIEVLDENDNPPIFRELKPVVQVDEMAKPGTLVYTAKATDKDSSKNNQITYSPGGELLLVARENVIDHFLSTFEAHFQSPTRLPIRWSGQLTSPTSEPSKSTQKSGE